MVTKIWRGSRLCYRADPMGCATEQIQWVAQRAHHATTPALRHVMYQREIWLKKMGKTWMYHRGRLAQENGENLDVAETRWRQEEGWGRVRW